MWRFGLVLAEMSADALRLNNKALSESSGLQLEGKAGRLNSLLWLELTLESQSCAITFVSDAATTVTTSVPSLSSVFS